MSDHESYSIIIVKKPYKVWNKIMRRSQSNEIGNSGGDGINDGKCGLCPCGVSQISSGVRLAYFLRIYVDETLIVIAMQQIEMEWGSLR